MQRVRIGDAAAFGELVTRYSTSALRVATVVLGTTEGAADAVQAATLKAWRARTRIDPARGFRSWYLRIVANTARNDHRSRSRRSALTVKASTIRPDSVVRPDDLAVTSSERETVVGALNDLPPADRLILALRFFEDMTQAEMAEILDCPLGTVKSRLSRAIAKLRNGLPDASEGEL